MTSSQHSNGWFQGDIFVAGVTWTLAIILLFRAVPATAASPRFESDIAPLIKARCAACHNAKVRQGGLSMETRDDLRAGGKTGAAIVPGRPSDSLLLSMVTTGRMPIGGAKLSPAEIDMLRTWIQEGALVQGETAAPKLISEKQIFHSILGAKCFACHGRRMQKGGLDLRSRAAMLNGGKSGPAIVPGKPEESLIVKKISGQKMPPPELQEQFSVRGLTDDELETLKAWIAAGAPVGTETAAADPPVKAADRGHWSFQPLVRPAVPTIAKHPVDAFLLARLQAKGLTFNPPASKLTLLRRVYFDLTGMPPTPAEIEAYSKDSRPDAYEQLIERLLESPRYGERWARFWLDAAGYADSEGAVSADNVRPFAWRYRDYVIRSLNADKPFDQFLREQIAGDEMFDYRNTQEYSPDQADKLIATGFLRMAPDSTYSTEQNFLAERFDTVAGQVDVLGTAVLGLTVGCARCHDHKYDPIPQRDYYKFSANLLSAYDPYDWLTPSLQCLGVGAKCDETTTRFLPLRNAAEERTVARFNEPLEKRITELQSQLDDKKKAPNAGTDEGKSAIAKLNRDLAAARRELKPKPLIRALFDMPGDPTPNRINLRGDFTNPGPLVAPGTLSVLGGIQPYTLQPVAHSSGRRLALANWLTQPDHPLTSRVFVNRVWQAYFSKGIVETAGNFGRTGKAPSHPELLDWLASEFARNGWSIKKLHRTILTSNAYRQSSAIDDARRQADPDNTLVSRFPLRRMDADSLRDSMLAVAQRLDLTPYGPPEPIDARDDGEVIVKPGKHGYRRSIYLQMRRSKPITLLEAFDAPQLTPNCLRRRESTVSSQALQLMNSDMVRETSRYMAGRILDVAGEDTARQVYRLYLAAFTREPGSEERSAAVATLRELTNAWRRQLESDKPAEPIERKAQWLALSTLCHTMLNAAEFLYVD